MRGLLLKLSGLDADAEGAIRLITFFDSLLEQEVPLDALLRNAAVVADCPVGIQDSEGQFALRGMPNGSWDSARAGRHAILRDSAGYRVWLDRDGADGSSLDELLLERLSIACLATLRRGDRSSPAVGDPALLEMVIARSTAAPERARAIHLLGIRPCTTLTLIAVLGPLDGVDALAADLGARDLRPHRAIVGTAHAMAITGQGPRDLQVPHGVSVGIGPPVHAVDGPTSWEKAVGALRYATPIIGGHADAGAYPVVHAADLGPYEFLAATLRSADIVDVTDLDALDDLATGPHGVDVLNTLSVLVAAGSLREAARQLHLHHNSVSARLVRAEERLGYRVTEPIGLSRLRLALALRRLREVDLPL